MLRLRLILLVIAFCFFFGIVALSSQAASHLALDEASDVDSSLKVNSKAKVVGLTTNNSGK